jgi:RNA polymerase sigma-70 factor, ECF subfamily
MLGDFLMSVDMRSDEELMRAYLDGEKSAIAILLTRRRDWMWSVARKTVRDATIAEDAVQEAMTAVFRKAHTFRSESKVSTWMYMIVQNACIDLLRKESVRPQLSESDESTVTESRSFADQSDTKIMMTQALATLPEDQRIALTMTIMEGYSIDEVATIAGVAPGTIKSRCSRGKEALAAYLTGRDLGNQDERVSVIEEKGGK